MAITNAKTMDEYVGQKKHQVFTVTFTSVTEGAVATGLDNVIFANFVNNTSEDDGIVYMNYSDAGSTAAKGQVYIYGVTSNDVGTLFVIGN